MIKNILHIYKHSKTNDSNYFQKLFLNSLSNVVIQNSLANSLVSPILVSVTWVGSFGSFLCYKLNWCWFFNTDNGTFFTLYNCPLTTGESFHFSVQLVSLFSLTCYPKLYNFLLFKTVFELRMETMFQCIAGWWERYNIVSKLDPRLEPWPWLLCYVLG